MLHPEASKDVRLAVGLVVEYWIETLRAADLTIQGPPWMTLGKCLNPSAHVAACTIRRCLGRFWQVLAHLCPDLVLSSHGATGTWMSVLTRMHHMLCFSFKGKRF